MAVDNRLMFADLIKLKQMMSDSLEKFLVNEKGEKEWRDLLNNDVEFLHSWEWGRFQEKLGIKIFRLNIDNEISALILKKPLPFKKSYFYIPRGPFIKNPALIIKKPDIFDDFLDILKDFAKKEGAVFVKIELASDDEKVVNIFKKLGFIRGESVQPNRTLLLDLSRPEDEIFKQTEHGVRYLIKVAKKRGVVIVNSADVDEKNREMFLDNFFEILESASHRLKIKIYSKNYFRQLLNLKNDINVEIFEARIENKSIASALVLFFGKRAVYLYAGANNEYRDLRAPSLLLWEIIVNAKKRGCEVLDYWGIADGRKKDWTGFTTFKKSFGGKEYQYGGALDFVFKKKDYFLYMILKRLKDLYKKFFRIF